MSIKDYIEIKITQLMIWRLRKGYGANCETKDIDDFPNEDISKSRCPSCKYKECIDLLNEHIENIKY